MRNESLSCACGDNAAATGPAAPKPLGFGLLWTVGFGGKRFFPADREPIIREAIRQAVDFLCVKARRQEAGLTAVSSLARGGDILFAETVQQANACDLRLQWKCLLPFAWEKFLEYDLAEGPDGQALPPQEFRERRARAENCRKQSRPAPEETCRLIDPAARPARDEAYLDCGYRTVDESDVMLLLLQRDEIATLQSTGAPPGQPGTLALATYALAARRPMILLPVESDDPWRDRKILNDPEDLTPPAPWFVDPVATDVVRRATRTVPPSHEGEPPPGPMTAARASVWQMQQRLDHFANTRQRYALDGLRWILRCHLAASILAALMATIFAVKDPRALSLLLVPFLLLAFAKPILASGALWLERTLHHGGERKDWLHARILSELCRGAVATWPLPLQPLDASDEEDFPRVKRLIRTLRLLRDADEAAGVRASSAASHETRLEADMREACRHYIEHRLRHQARYYGQRHGTAEEQARTWRDGFVIATWTAIITGGILALHKLPWALGQARFPDFIEHSLEAGVIIAPFVAAHCLNVMTLLDARRRSRRYDEMQHYLERLADTLARTEANPSRVRLIEHAERMMIEERHEWFSVMRNFSV